MFSNFGTRSAGKGLLVLLVFVSFFIGFLIHFFLSWICQMDPPPHRCMHTHIYPGFICLDSLVAMKLKKKTLQKKYNKVVDSLDMFWRDRKSTAPEPALEFAGPHCRNRLQDPITMPRDDETGGCQKPPEVLESGILLRDSS